MSKIYAVFTFRKRNNPPHKRVFRHTEVDSYCTTPQAQGEVLSHMITAIEAEPEYEVGRIYFESMQLKEI